MERASFADMDCPIARAVDEVGEGWTLLVLREAFKGSSTFSEFQSRLPIAPTTLTRRLEQLTERGFFERRTYQRRPPRERYALTEKALELLPILVALGDWGNRWLAPEGPLLEESSTPRAARPWRSRSWIGGRAPAPRPGRIGLLAGPGARKEVREALQRPLVLGGDPRRS